MECDKCGEQRDRKNLFDAISDGGIIKLCEKCLREENIPIIKKKIIEEIEQKQSIPEIKPKRLQVVKKDDKEEVSLRDIVERNIEDKDIKKLEKRRDLINNFHWIIMRARRLKHLTQKQFADAIHESEEAIKMAERGIVPERGYQLINKIEKFLDIQIVKKEFIEDSLKERDLRLAAERQMPKETGELKFDQLTTQRITIKDLQEMKKRKEEEMIPVPNLEEKQEESIDMAKKEEDSKKELSKKDIDNLIFRR